MIKQSEADIQRVICAYLSAKCYYFWRENNVGVYDEKRKAYRSNRYGIHGIADIIILAGDITWSLEVKTAKGRQSESQKEFQIHCFDSLITG